MRRDPMAEAIYGHPGSTFVKAALDAITSHIESTLGMLVPAAQRELLDALFGPPEDDDEAPVATPGCVTPEDEMRLRGYNHAQAGYHSTPLACYRDSGNGPAIEHLYRAYEDGWNIGHARRELAEVPRG